MSIDNIMEVQKMSFKDAVEIAKKGTHCGMCRFDFLGSGVCPAGRKKGFLAYWPQGRMEIVKQLDSGRVKPTEKLKDIVESCNLCGFWRRQLVMQSLPLIPRSDIEALSRGHHYFLSGAGEYIATLSLGCSGEMFRLALA